MKNKIFLGFLAVLLVFSFIGLKSNSAKAEIKEDSVEKQAEVFLSEEANMKEVAFDNFIENEILISEETGEKVDIYSQVIDLINNNPGSRNTWKCKETVTFPSGGTVSQTYSSATNISGTYCTTNGTRVSIECSQMYD